ncbi:uncharacterized protein LOC143230499 [Tachypleus tridentatus]|uniref:uncharacterized protein LOC143230499 n=1 Tax=Tachypleus tridentatus TaxID=6853 RepID=UPI003FD17BF7
MLGSSARPSSLVTLGNKARKDIYGLLLRNDHEEESIKARIVSRVCIEVLLLVQSSLVRQLLILHTINIKMMRLAILACLCVVALAEVFPFNVPEGKHDPAFLQNLQQEALNYINQQQVSDLEKHKAEELKVEERAAKQARHYYPGYYNPGYYHPNYYYPGNYYGGYYHPGHYYSALHHSAALHQHSLDEQKSLKEREKVLEAEKTLIASH